MEDKQLTDMYADRKNDVYAARAMEVVDNSGGALERRDFGLAGMLGLACIVTCVYATSLTTLAAGISSGGPVLLLWGLFVAAGGALLIALSLAELASAYPSSRGVLEWSYVFASPRYRRPVSYVVGHLNWIGYSVIQAGFGVLMGQQILALVVLRNPDFVIKQWQVWLIGEASVLCGTVFNIFGMSLMPILDKFALYFFLFTFLCFLIIPIACASHLQPSLEAPKFVFATFINETGWQDFVAFMVGLGGLSAAFGGTDAITHIAEECNRPEVIIPQTMILTVGIGFLSTFALLISLLYAMVDIDSILGSPTGVPYIQLLYNATQSYAGTVCLSLCIIIITFLGLIGLILTASRIAYTIARDGGFFSENYFALVSVRNQVPTRTIIFTSCFSAALLCISLGSTTALVSFLNTVMILNWICYGTCIVLVLLAGRRFEQRGPFHLGRAGWVINILTVLYMTFQGIFFTFPYGLPAAVESMNYSSVVFMGLVVLVVVSWFITEHHYLAVKEGVQRSDSSDGERKAHEGTATVV